MKKSIYLVALLLLGTVAQAQNLYVEQTTKAFSSATDKKASGKLLPTTQFEVLKTQGDKLFVKLNGWTKGKVTRVVYFSKGERIIQAAFSKKAKYDVKVLDTVKVGKHDWSKVSVTTWINNSNNTKDLQALYSKASDMLQKNCGLCHAYHPTHEFSANQWPSIIKGMLPRTPLSKEQGWLITQYAQKHAKK